MDQVFYQKSDNTLFIFYLDLLEGFQSINDNPIIHILRNDFKFETILRNLTLKQQLKIRNVKNELDRYVKLINLLILKYIIMNYENCEDKNIEIDERRGAFGKPFLRNYEYQYNISDENSIVSIAIGFNPSFKKTEIGLDLANPKDIESFQLSKLENFYKHDFRQIFTDNEVEKLDTIFKNLDYNQRLNTLSGLWALKESYCKYLGVGITAGMENYEFIDIPELVNFDADNNFRHDFEKNQKFEIVKQIQLGKITRYDPKNACFKIPNTEIICSVFSQYENACLVNVNVEELIKVFH